MSHWLSQRRTLKIGRTSETTAASWIASPIFCCRRLRCQTLAGPQSVGGQGIRTHKQTGPIGYFGIDACFGRRAFQHVIDGASPEMTAPRRCEHRITGAGIAPGREQRAPDHLRQGCGACGPFPRERSTLPLPRKMTSDQVNAALLMRRTSLNHSQRRSGCSRGVLAPQPTMREPRTLVALGVRAPDVVVGQTRCSTDNRQRVPTRPL